jgi:hypothetical protein
MQTEKEKFLAWYKKEKEENGLIDFKLTLDPLRKLNTTEEDVYAAINAMNAAYERGECKPFDDTDICNIQQKLNEEVYKELNAMNDAVARGERKPLKDI